MTLSKPQLINRKNIYGHTICWAIGIIFIEIKSIAKPRHVLKFTLYTLRLLGWFV